MLVGLDRLKVEGFEDTSPLAFSADGSKLAFDGRNGAELWLKVVAAK